MGDYSQTDSNFAWFIYVTDGGAVYKFQQRKDVGLYVGNGTAPAGLPVIPAGLVLRTITIKANDPVTTFDHLKQPIIGNKVNFAFQGNIPDFGPALLDGLSPWRIIGRIGESWGAP